MSQPVEVRTTLKQFTVELLFPVEPREVGLQAGPTDLKTDVLEQTHTEIKVALLREDESVLFVGSGAFSSGVVAHQQLLDFAVDLLGDLGSNAATAGVLRPLRVVVTDICGVSDDLQRKLPSSEVNDGAKPDDDGLAGVGS